MDKPTEYTYKILKSDGSFKLGFTNGEFSLWSRSHFSDEREAIFSCLNSVKVISYDMLTDETLARIPPMPRNIPDYPGFDQKNRSYLVLAKQAHALIIKECLMRGIFRYIAISGSVDITKNRKAILNAPWAEWIDHLWIREDGMGEKIAEFNFETFEWEDGDE